MSRLEISNDGRLSSEMIGVIFGLGLIIGLAFLSWSRWTFIVTPICLAVIYLVISFYARFRKSSFDAEQLYYMHDGHEVAVPLKDIIGISRTYWSIQGEGEIYQIEFRQGKERSIKIAPFSPTNFASFLNSLKGANPEVQIDRGVVMKKRMLG